MLPSGLIRWRPRPHRPTPAWGGKKIGTHQGLSHPLAEEKVALEQADDRGNRLEGGGFIADVERVATRGAAGRGDLGLHTLESLDPTTGDRYRGAEARKVVGDAAADPAAATGHDDRPAREEFGCKDGAVALGRGQAPAAG